MVLDEGRVVYAEKGRVSRLDHVIRDITEEKRALDALKQSEEKYRSFFSKSTNDMAYAMGTPEEDFIDINDAGLKLLGFESKGEALRTKHQAKPYVDPSEREELLAELRDRGYVTDKRVKLKTRLERFNEIAINCSGKDQ